MKEILKENDADCIAMNYVTNSYLRCVVMTTTVGTPPSCWMQHNDCVKASCTVTKSWDRYFHFLSQAHTYDKAQQEFTENIEG